MRHPNIKTILFYFFIITAFSFLTSYQSSADLHSKVDKTGVAYWSGNPDLKKVAITFDDGPNEKSTPKILDILDRFDAEATFFVLGKYEDKYPDIAKRIVASGHAIGNHTYSHPDLRFKFKSGIRAQIEKAQESIYNATSVHTRIFRPPYGACNGRIKRIAKDMGFFVIEYSLSTSDGGRKIASSRIVRTVSKGIRNGSIVLLHDGDRFNQNADRKNTVLALPIILKNLKDAGYEFVTVPELLNLDTQ